VDSESDVGRASAVGISLNFIVARSLLALIAALFSSHTRQNDNRLACISPVISYVDPERHVFPSCREGRILSLVNRSLPLVHAKTVYPVPVRGDEGFALSRPFDGVQHLGVRIGTVSHYECGTGETNRPETMYRSS
jgi:hypothetical protein